MTVELFSPKARMPAIRPLAAEDCLALLRLNQENHPAVAPLNEDELANMLAFEGTHRVATDEQGAVVGYLLSFPSESKYDDTEFCWFRQRLSEPFVYICQIVIAPEHRRKQIGHAFYCDLSATARKRGARILCCDVNIDPPNVESFAFHRGQGFVVIGLGNASNGIAVSFLARRV